MATLWQKNEASLKEVLDFTSGNDRQMDLFLAPFDVLGSLAHIQMLESVGLLTKEELTKLQVELRTIYKEMADKKFSIEEGVEDIHSQVEILLTKKLGDTGKKIHSGRSRNDQVLVDLKLFIRQELRTITEEVKILFDLLIKLSETHQKKLMPGYTHFQAAMPSSFGLWFGAYAESLTDDITLLHAAWRVVNKNPLGSAAGYGSSFPLNRKMTTELLGFDELNYNVVYAQMGRGKTERIVAAALANIGATLSKLAMDACLFLNPNFGFISFPDELTTGSSIMPHKKNPDVFEIIRARGNQLQALPNDISLTTANLPSGYHRDLQVLKEKLFPAFHIVKDCLKMTVLMLSHIEIKENILTHDLYKFIFSVEEVNRLTLEGIPFREAYKKVGLDIEAGHFNPKKETHHTHEGSIGNLNLKEIQEMMEREMSRFSFEKMDRAVGELLAK